MALLFCRLVSVVLAKSLVLFSGSVACSIIICSHVVVSKNSNANHLYAGDNIISPISSASVSI